MRRRAQRGPRGEPFGGQEAAAEDDVHRQRLAHGPRHALRPSGARNHADPGFRLTELSGLGSDDQVAGHGQLAAAAEAEARDRRHQRRPKARDHVPALDTPLVVEVDRRRLRQLGDVGTRCECSLGAAEHDAAHVLPVQLRQPRDELVHQLVRKRVQRVGAVEQDDGDRALALDEDELTHFLSRKRRTAPCVSSLSIESDNQSRACPTVPCQARSRQKLSCCFA